LLVAGTPPFLCAGVTGRALARQCLEGLAVQTGSTRTNTEVLLQRLHEAAPPLAPALLATTRARSLPEDPSQGPHRPLAWLNMPGRGCGDLFGWDQSAGVPGDRESTPRF